MATIIWENLNVESYGKKGNSELDVIHPGLIGMLEPVRGKDIVDYGCGEGKLVAELIRRGANVRGYDISKAMIQKARQRIGNDRHLEVIKSGKIPLQDNTLDAVVSNLVLMMCPSLREMEQIFREINRVLKQRGSWIYCVTHPAFVDREFTTYRNIFKGKRNYFAEGESYQFVLRRQDGTEVTDKSFVDHNYTLSSYLNLLPKTGFEFRELREVKLKRNDVPPYIIVRGNKK